MLKAAISSAIFFFAFVQPVSAFNPKDPPSDAVINHTLQCEAGKVGRALKKYKLPQNLKTAVSWTVSKTEDSGWGFSIKVPIFNIGFDAGTTQQNLDEASSTGVPFNMHPDNLAVCRGFRRTIITEGVGLEDCLVNQKFTSLTNVITGGSGTTGCHSKVTLGRKLSGTAQIPLWGVGVGPSGNVGDTFVMDFTVVAPLRSKP